MISLSLALASLVSSAPPVDSAGRATTCVQAMGDLLQRQQFSELLAAAPGCARESAHPRIYYFAGIAHLALEQPALAVEALQRYLASESEQEPEALRDRAHGRLEQAKSRAGRILVRVTSARHLSGVVISVRREGDAAATLTKHLQSLESIDGRAALWVDPGRVRISVSAGGMVTMEREVEVVAGVHDVPLELTLVAKPPPPPPSPPKLAPKPEVTLFPRKPWLRAVGPVGGVLAGGGVVLLPLAQVRIDERLDFEPDCITDDDLNGCREEVAWFTAMGGAGAGLAGAGLGVFVAGMTALLPRPPQRRTAWILEAGLGAALVAGGATSLGFGLQAFNRVNLDSSDSALPWGSPYRREINAHARVYILGSGLLGAGVGLGVSALAGLLVSKFTHRQSRHAQRWQPQPWGIGVRF